MKYLLRSVCVLLLVLSSVSIVNAQPNYTLTAKNFVVNSASEFKFDMYITRTGGGTENFVKGQFCITYNQNILPVGSSTATLSMTFLSGSSELPAGQQSTNCIDYAGGASGYALYVTAPLDNLPGAVIPNSPTEARIGTYVVNNTLGFSAVALNAAWRHATPNPFTKIWYNASGTSTQLLDANINYVVIGGDIILPVELSSFTANIKQREVELVWETKTEVNTSMFQIERALVKDNVKTFAKIGEVAASGNSNSPKSYNFVDKKLQSGKYVYRLKMVDADGSFQYSKEVEGEVALPKEFGLSQNYPNPFNPTTRIDYQLPFDSKVNIELYGITGERIATIINNELSAGYYTLDINASALNLASGVYIYRMNATGQNNQNFVQVKKLMLTK